MAKVVVYIGKSDEREISTWSWGAVGAPGQKYARWCKENSWQIPAAWFSEGAMEYLNRDPDFEVRDDS